MSCIDCNNKAKEFNMQLDSMRSVKTEEPMAIVKTEDGIFLISVIQAIGQKLPIIEVIMPQDD